MRILLDLTNRGYAREERDRILLTIQVNLPNIVKKMGIFPRLPGHLNRFRLSAYALLG
jgi:hypothetical protein